MAEICGSGCYFIYVIYNVLFIMCSEICSFQNLISGIKSNACILGVILDIAVKARTVGGSTHKYRHKTNIIIANLKLNQIMNYFIIIYLIMFKKDK